MTMQDLMNKRANTWDAMKKLLDEKTNESGVLQAEDAQQYDRMEQEYSALTDQIERMKRMDQIENELRKPVRDELRADLRREDKKEKTGRKSEAYNAAFGRWLQVRSEGVTPEIRNALQVGTASEGGYLVPEEFENRLVQALTDTNIIRQLATVVKTNGERVIPIETTRGAATWAEEEATKPENDPAFGEIRLGAHKLTTRVKVSEELMQDSAFDMANYIAQNFGVRFGEAEETAFLKGTGTTQPTGLTHSTNGATLVNATGYSFDAMLEAYYKLREPYRRNAVWVMGSADAVELRKLKDSNGQYLWQPAVAAEQPEMLLGRPVYTAYALDGEKKILFGDMQYYWIADRTTRTVQRLNELYAENGQVGFVGTQRVDGKLVLKEAVLQIEIGQD